MVGEQEEDHPTRRQEDDGQGQGETARESDRGQGKLNLSPGGITNPRGAGDVLGSDLTEHVRGTAQSEVGQPHMDIGCEQLVQSNSKESRLGQDTEIGKENRDPVGGQETHTKRKIIKAFQRRRGTDSGTYKPAGSQAHKKERLPLVPILRGTQIIPQSTCREEKCSQECSHDEAEEARRVGDMEMGCAGVSGIKRGCGTSREEGYFGSEAVDVRQRNKKLKDGSDEQDCSLFLAEVAKQPRQMQ